MHHDGSHHEVIFVQSYLSQVEQTSSHGELSVLEPIRTHLNHDQKEWNVVKQNNHIQRKVHKLALRHKLVVTETLRQRYVRIKVIKFYQLLKEFRCPILVFELRYERIAIGIILTLDSIEIYGLIPEGQRHKILYSINVKCLVKLLTMIMLV